MIITPYAALTRPNDTTTYASGDLIANSTTAGSVTPLAFGVTRLGSGAGRIFGARLWKDDETVTAASFVLYLFEVAPTVTNGDNGAFAVNTTENFIGQIALDLSSGALASTTDVTESVAVSPNLCFDLEHKASAGRTIYGFLTAAGSYAPSANEVFKVWLHMENDL